MERIELKVNSSAEPTEFVDSMCEHVPELKQRWTESLDAARNTMQDTLELPPWSLSKKPSKNFQVVGMLYKTVCPFLRENEYPRKVILNCLSEDDATMYRQIYNFYIPNTKAERMNNGAWD